MRHAGVYHAALAQVPVPAAPQAEVTPVMLLREALRRLATSLATAEQAGIPLPAATHVRYEAVRSILNSWPALQPGP